MESNRENSNEIVLNGIMQMIGSHSENVWSGSMTELNTQLARCVGRKNLPRSASALRVVVNRIVNRLRSRGVGVKFGRSHTTRFVRFTCSG